MNRNLQPLSSESTAPCAAACAAKDVTLDGCDGELTIGAHLVTQRRGYDHHGIYVGNGRVIHYAGFAKSAHRGPVEEVPLERFADGRAVVVRPHAFLKFSGEQAVNRARSRLGENHYRLLTNNCEHFCTWCLLGESRSEQVSGCFTHPGAGLRALACLVTVFVARRMGFAGSVASAVRVA